MSLERSDPIPPGRYWVDVMRNDDRKPFADWLAANKSTVRVLAREDRGKNTAYPSFSWLDPHVYGLWVLFEVTSPTKRWPVSIKIGFPNRAGAAKSRADTVTKAPTKDVLKYWSDKTGDILTTPGGAMGALVLVFLLTRKR
jgi:hypothetical protein